MNLGLLPLSNQGVKVGSNGDLVIGASIDAPFSKQTIVIGKNNSVMPYCDNNIILGNGCTIQSLSQYANNNNIVIGQNCFIGRNTSGSVSGNSIVIGNNASLGNLNTTNSFVNNSVIIGNGASSTGTNGVCIGPGTSGSSIAIGNGVGSGASAGNVALGGSATGTACTQIGPGNNGGFSYNVNFAGATPRASSSFQVGVPALASSQWGVIVFGNTTADATQTELFAWPTLSHRFALANNSMLSFYGYLVARNTSNNDTATWRVEGVVKRTANAASIALVGTPSSTQIAVDSGASTWTYVLDADTTNGSLRVRVTGVAATTIRWYVALHTTEIS